MSVVPQVAHAYEITHHFYVHEPIVRETSNGMFRLIASQIMTFGEHFDLIGEIVSVRVID